MGYKEETKALNKERDEKIVEMYKQGVLQAQIAKEMHVCRETVRAVVKKAGVYIDGRGNLMRSKKGNEKIDAIYKAREAKIYNNHSKESRDESKAVEKLKQAVTIDDIKKFRLQIKVGSYINIKTNKGMNADADSRNTLTGVVRRAMVTNTSHPKFCEVRIEENGVMEYVLWRDMVIADRNNREYVG